MTTILRFVSGFGVLAVLLASCATPEVTTEPDEVTEQEPEEDSEPVDEPEDSEPVDEPEDSEEESEPVDEPEDSGDIQARIGDTITLASSLDEARIATTLVRLIDPATSEFLEPDGRLVAIEVSYENVGDVVYDDAPLNQWEVVDNENRQHRGTVGEVEDCPAFGGTMRLAVGDIRVGCVAFDIPEDVEVQYVNAALDSGFADQTGRWLP